MAVESNNFLDEKTEPVSHKLMAKYVALAAVIFVILILCVLAWFASRPEADASGLSIKTSTDNGLQVAITDHDTDTGKGSKWTDYAYKWTYHSGFSAENPLPLISGDGLQFFEPTFIKVAEDPYEFLDLDELAQDGLDVTWTDVTDKKNESTGEKSDYIEYKMKFRNTKPSNVFLRSDSEVSPFDISSNHNPWLFSRDYIAATARVAFLKNDSGGNLAFHSLWIPNEKMQLKHQDRAETKVVSYEEKSPDGTVREVAGTSTGIPTGGTPTTFYAWVNSSDTYTGNNYENMVTYYNNMKATPLMNKGSYYYCHMHAPACSGNDDRAFFVTRGSSKSLSSNGQGYLVNNKFDLIGGHVMKQYQQSDGTWVTVQFESDDYNIAFRRNGGGYDYVLNCEKVYISPHDKELDYYLIIDKQGNVTDVIIDEGSGSTEPSYSVNINKSVYVPKNNDILLISASNTTRNYGLPNYGGTAVDVGMVPAGEGKPTWVVTNAMSSGAFKLRDSVSGRYLSISSTGISYNTTGSYFYAVTKYEKEQNGSKTTTKLNGVMLYSLENNLFVKFDGTKFTSSKSYDTTYTYHMYIQSVRTDIQEGVWAINSNGDAEETFYYRDKDYNTKQALPSGKYFLTSDINDEPEYHQNETVATYPNFIVAVDKKDTDGFYVSDEVTVRVWGEGYDREAQTPVEGGKMKINLHFFAAVKDE